MFTKRQLTIELIKQLGKMLAALALVFIAVYFFGGQIQEMGKMAKEQRTAVFILEQRNQTANMLKEGFNLIGDGDEKLKNAFIEAENITDFVITLENLAKANKTKQTLKFGTPIPFPAANEIESNGLGLLKIGYTISLEGNSTSLINYLKDFEVLPYFTGVSSINLTSPPKGWEENANIQLKVTLYASHNE